MSRATPATNISIENLGLIGHLSSFEIQTIISNMANASDTNSITVITIIIIQSTHVQHLRFSSDRLVTV